MIMTCNSAVASLMLSRFLSYIMVRILFEEMLVLHVAHKQHNVHVYISHSYILT
jgi:hypothetical protein